MIQPICAIKPNVVRSGVLERPKSGTARFSLPGGPAFERGLPDRCPAPSREVPLFHAAWVRRRQPPWIALHPIYLVRTAFFKALFNRLSPKPKPRIEVPLCDEPPDTSRPTCSMYTALPGAFTAASRSPLTARGPIVEWHACTAESIALNVTAKPRSLTGGRRGSSGEDRHSGSRRRSCPDARLAGCAVRGDCGEHVRDFRELERHAASRGMADVRELAYIAVSRPRLHLSIFGESFHDFSASGRALRASPSSDTDRAAFSRLVTYV